MFFLFPENSDLLLLQAVIPFPSLTPVTLTTPVHSVLTLSHHHPLLLLLLIMSQQQQQVGGFDFKDKLEAWGSLPYAASLYYPYEGPMTGYPFPHG